MVYYRLLNIVPCATQKDLVVYQGGGGWKEGWSGRLGLADVSYYIWNGYT